MSPVTNSVPLRLRQKTIVDDLGESARHQRWPTQHWVSYEDSSLVEYRGVEQCDRALTTWGAIVGYGHDRLATQLSGQAFGLADRRRREHERRVASVVLADPSKTTEYMRDVGAEHTPQHVELVDDDVIEPPQKGRPAAVARQDRAMNHLGVRQHDVCG